MKNLFAAVAVVAALSLVSCEGKKAESSAVDSTAIKDSIAKAEEAAKATPDTAAKDTAAVKDTTAKKTEEKHK